MLKSFLIVLFFIQINYLNNYIILPIKTLPKENYVLYDKQNYLKKIIFSEYYTSFFTELYIGKEKQRVPLLIEAKTNDFLVTSIHLFQNNASDYYLNKTIYNFTKVFLEDYDFFNENKSNSLSCKNYEQRKKNKNSKEIPIAEISCPANNIFYFYKNINMKNKEEENLYFELAQNMKDNITGIIGLGLYDSYFRRTSSFLYNLKQYNITQNYYWFFEFNSTNNENGKLIIGSSLDEIYRDKYDKNDLTYANANQGNSYWKIQMDKIFVQILSYEYDLGAAYCELSFDTNIIIANDKYKKYFELNFNDLLKQDKCFKDTFEGQNSFYSNKIDLIFYYCKNEKNIKEKLYEIILPIKYYSREFNYTFEINIDDILKEKDNFIFFKILFGVKSFNYWILGKIFSLKYKFIFNPELKKIGFYPKFKDRNPNNNNGINNDNNGDNNNFLSKVSQFLIIIASCILLIFIIIIFVKKLFSMKKKKRANELEDDYEYLSEDKKENKIEKEEDYGKADEDGIN